MSTAVDRLYDADGALLYVSATGHPDIRFREHATTRPWYPQVARSTVAVEVMTEEEFDIRDGFDDAEQGEPAPALIGTADAAERLGVTTARVNQLAREGKLDATRLGAQSWGFDFRQIEGLERARVVPARG